MPRRAARRSLVRPLLAAFFLACVAGFVVFVHEFPRRYPDAMLRLELAATSALEQVTMPIKLARLAMLPPDAELRMPVYGVRSASDTFGAPRGADRSHEGIDIFAAKGTPVFSATSGYVRRIGNNTLGGNHVFVTGAGGRRYYYAHLDSVAEGLRAGQEVTVDTVLGFVGNTGNAATTPPHLHFGMYEGRQALNPHAIIVPR